MLLCIRRCTVYQAPINMYGMIVHPLKLQSHFNMYAKEKNSVFNCLCPMLTDHSSFSS
jgi:hypothetical protein